VSADFCPGAATPGATSPTPEETGFTPEATTGSSCGDCFSQPANTVCLQSDPSQQFFNLCAALACAALDEADVSADFCPPEATPGATSSTPEATSNAVPCDECFSQPANTACLQSDPSQQFFNLCAAVSCALQEADEVSADFCN